MENGHSRRRPDAIRLVYKPIFCKQNTLSIFQSWVLKIPAIYENLAITCWPNETGDGTCDVSVEYELQQEHLELADVTIRIPIPSGVGAPVVGTCDGDYNHDSRKNILEWKLPVIGRIYY